MTIADTKRLDWIQANETSVYEVIRTERRPTTTPDLRYEEHRVFLGWSVGSRDDECATVREAIDKAMGDQNTP